MAEHRDRAAVPVDPATDHVLRGDHDHTARDLIARFGAGAISYAIDCDVRAREREDHAAMTFWSRVCFAVIQLRLAGGDHV